MKNYELLFVLPGTLTEQETEPFVEKVKSTLTQNNAANLMLEAVGKNRLAYPIKHIRYGYIYLLRFEAEAEQITKIEKRLRLIEGLLRSLIQVYDPEKQKTAKINFINLRAPELERQPRSTRPVSRREATIADRIDEARGSKMEDKEDFPSDKVFGKEISESDQTAASREFKDETELAEIKKEKPKAGQPKKAVSFEEIDKKLDELLDSDIASV